LNSDNLIIKSIFHFRRLMDWIWRCMMQISL